MAATFRDSRTGVAVTVGPVQPERVQPEHPVWEGYPVGGTVNDVLAWVAGAASGEPAEDGWPVRAHAALAVEMQDRSRKGVVEPLERALANLEEPDDNGG